MKVVKYAPWGFWKIAGSAVLLWAIAIYAVTALYGLVAVWVT